MPAGREELFSQHSHDPKVQQHPQPLRPPQAPSPWQQMWVGKQDLTRQCGCRAREMPAG